MNDDTQLVFILEALIMSAAEPMSISTLQEVFDEIGRPDRKTILGALSQLAARYESSALELVSLASGYTFLTRSAYSPWIAKALADRPVKYSRALMETLAIIAYRQPVTRADIEDIRGVAVSTNIIKTLLEREWIKIAGQRDVPGKPSIYVTTVQFLDYFKLNSIDNLPELNLSLIMPDTLQYAE